MNIVIKDLEFSKELDAKAMSQLVGGRSSHTKMQSMSSPARKKGWMAQYNKRQYMGR